ncbi:hypothetical protein [Granulicella sp. L60]|uniref:hypothetical protein n=1 Tax=Granulicella sp. L60 TaxID=1641866 RepID=UPI00131DE259|nr:hypothetical protein [Granulicella sp. L60]
MKKRAYHLITEVPPRQSRVAVTIGIDLGDVGAITNVQPGWLSSRPSLFRTTPKAIEKWITDLSPIRVGYRSGTAFDLNTLI